MKLFLKLKIYVDILISLIYIILSNSDFKMATNKLKMVVTDLDGTLLNPERQVSELDYRSLELLGEKNIYRIVATGRSIYSVNKVLPYNFPIDYLIFSSGSGILDWNTKEILFAQSLNSTEVLSVTHYLIELNINFMVHKPIPDNHHFAYYQTENENSDFQQRIKIYDKFAQPLTTNFSDFGAACQFVVIIPENVSLYKNIKEKLSQFNVIRATSPLDGKSIWIEIFPKNVSKGSAAAYLCHRLGCNRSAVLGIGNDYNDLDLLNWTGHSIVVANAPGELKNKFKITDSNADSGFSKTIQVYFSK